MSSSRAVCIVGTGYVGMACMIGLAELGWRVHGYDISAERVERLKLGIPPYREPGILEALREHLDAGKMHFFEDLDAAARDAQIVIVAVGTPSREDGSADISALQSVIHELAKVKFASWPTIVIRSTVPPGTTDALAHLARDWGDVVYAPEFLREGTAVRDFLDPDRVVVGCETPASAVGYVRLFERLQRPVLFTSRSSAELIKCCSNAFLALKISFANEVANLCDACDGMADDVLRGIGYDQRIGSQFLRPGIGFGGPCFEKDVKSMEFVARERGVGRELLSAMLRVNDAQPKKIIDLLENEIGALAEAKIGVWGLAFKAGTDDIRNSLALIIVEELSRRGASTVVFDPAVHVAPLPRDSRLVTSALEAAKADALLVLTEWPEFARIDPNLYAATLNLGVVIDGRNILDPDRVASAGLNYRGVGRGVWAPVDRPRVASVV
ncbi:MAG TPA: UDP-glucose/GDP-mannose dehydrogenase family protein [Candidatus Baltobacteraceae bacterium]|jgi:UDPglucose 6-dehydrogenase